MDWGGIITNTNLINALGSVGTFLTFLAMFYFIYIEHRKIKIETKSKIYYTLYKDIKSLINECKDYQTCSKFLEPLRGIEIPRTIYQDVAEVNERLKSYHDVLQAAKDRTKDRILY